MVQDADDTGRGPEREGLTMKRSMLVVTMTLALVAAACTSNGGGTNTSGSPGGSSGPVELTMWMGYTKPPPVNQSYEYLSLQKIVDAYNASQTAVHVTTQYVNSDNALTKVTVALTGNKQPDISYQYGTNMPQLANTPKLVDLTQKVQEADFNWDDFFPGERAVATVDGRVLGIPALVDNLAVVYNKDLFAAAGVPTPKADWTWDDLRAAAKATSDPSNNVFGLAFPADGSETTVWEYEAMLWEAGGDILNADNTQATFNSAQGVRALTELQGMQQDGSLYLDFHPDAGQSESLFNSGKIGMMITGPWDLSGFPDVNYGVQVMPSFDAGGSHITIAGPDNWVIFDNGQARVDASWDFLKYLSSPQNLLEDAMATGHLPTRASVAQLPDFAQFNVKYPGAGTFADNLVNVQKARPQIATYPTVSAALGQAVVSVLTGEGEPQQELDSAAQTADGALAAP
jgi:multiple sugar transport system substrate-binding protein